jgi:internalin A
MSAIPPSEALAEAEALIAKCRNTHSEDLDLSKLGLRELPESLRSLRWLTELNVARNDLTHVPQWLGELTQLRMLSLSANPLETLPTSLGSLARLERLWLTGLRPSIAHEDLGFQNLTALGIGASDLTLLPDWIRRLRNLEVLMAGNNNISSLPEWIAEFSKLDTLDVSGNPLRRLPVSLLTLVSLKELDLSRTQLHLPGEIVRTRNASKILNYYFRSVPLDVTTSPSGSKSAPEDPRLTHHRQSRMSQPLNEFKLVLVGRGGVGKTTLVNRLVTDDYKEFQRTPGVHITQWSMPIDGDTVNAHVWDFGGQEIMHGTHRFFMTERALYLVLISGREGTEDHDADYWLSMVRSFAGDVPVVMLLHKWGEYRFELNRKLLREKYGQSIIFAETDSLTGHGISALREQIRQLATKLPGLRAVWPAAWQRVKDDLPKQKKNWLTFEEFLAFCRERDVTDRRDQEALAENLHDLGLMLSYRNDEALRGFGVLNPQWVTEGIYNMLNAPALRDANGRFTPQMFSEVLPQEAYPKELHPYLLALMRKFRLCHPLDTKGTQYLIPELLTKEEPSLNAEFAPEKCLGFIYRYDSVLPEGLIPRFIVETYVHGAPKLSWRTGVVLERANCRALVRGDVQGRTITIWVEGIGNGRRELLGIIREHFDRIHKSYEELPVTELVPIPGYPATHVEHKVLLKYERSRQPTIKVDIGDELRDYSVKELLDVVDLPGAPRARATEARGVQEREQFEHREAIQVFISYSRKDGIFLDQLRAALFPYERKGELTVWADELVEPGQSWEDEIQSRLDQAQLVILLLSNDFLGSSYCMDKEFPRVMARRKAGECEIVPIVIRACRYDKHDSLGALQAILVGGKPINEHEKSDPAWHEVTQRLDPVIEKLKKR